MSSIRKSTRRESRCKIPSSCSAPSEVRTVRAAGAAAAARFGRRRRTGRRVGQVQRGQSLRRKLSREKQVEETAKRENDTIQRNSLQLFRIPVCPAILSLHVP